MDNENEVILHLPQDINKLCRTCMSVTENIHAHDILLMDGNKKTLAGEMFSCFITNLKINDNLPKSICDDCASKLEFAYNFKNQCSQTDTNLRKLLNISVEEQCENPENNTEEKPDVGNILFQSSSVKNLPQFDEDVNEKYVISFDAILKDATSSNLDEDNNLILSEKKKAAKQTPDYEHILELIEERKHVLIEQCNIKVEQSSDNEESMEIFCSFCDKFFNTSEDFEVHLRSCRLLYQNVLKVEDNTFDESVEYLEEENLPSSEGSPVKRMIFRCNICNYEFSTRQARNVHMATHNYTLPEPIEGGLYHCDICSKRFPNETKLISHFYKHILFLKKDMQKQNPEQEETDSDVKYSLLTCGVCNEKFATGESLKRHRNIHLNKNVECNVCNKSCLGEIALVKHLRIHGVKIFLCKLCLKRFDDSVKLREHQKFHYFDKSKTNVSCPLCKETFISLLDLKNHCFTHLNDAFECDRCNRRFTNKVVYESHCKQHIEPRYLCSLCGKQYFSNVTLACHIRSHNNEKPFECPHCKKRFTSRATLSVHKRIHSDKKPYICSYCGYSCRQSGDLAMHIRTHTGVKPYKCKFPDCERRFTTSSQRMEHHRRHTNERNHKCFICNKAFLESKTLKVHMLTHTGEKPHECKVCGRRFRRTHHLTNHMKGHKGIISSSENDKETVESVELLGI